MPAKIDFWSRVRVVDSIAYVKLGSGEEAIVDADVLPRMARFSWQALRTSSNVYVIGNSYVSDGPRYCVNLHRFVMGHPKGFEVDHINRNGLDNRRCNLRVCTRQENARNVPRRASAKGVKFDKRTGKFVARINVNRKHHHLGVFTTESEAMRAYDEAALRFHGAFARTNFMEA